MTIASGRPTVFIPPSLRRFSPDRVPEGAWSEHLPLAYDLVAALKPRLVVAVGVRRGAAFYGFCQSVREHDLETLCYAVGGWEAASEGPQRSPLDHFRDYGRTLYADIAYILPASPEEALRQFDDGTVDILYLDEDVGASGFRDAFEVWYPKLRSGGVLAAHDLGAPGSLRRAEWETLSAGRDPLAFDGSPPLGLLRKPGPGEEDDDEGFLRLVFESDAVDRERLRAIYARAARYLELGHRVGSGRLDR